MQAGIRGMGLASVAVAMLTAAPGGYADDQDGQTFPKGAIFMEGGAEEENEAETGDSHVLTLPGGVRYKGEIYVDVPHGKGVMTLPDGRRFDGWFDNGLFTGGALEWPDGRRYKGGFFGSSERKEHRPFLDVAHGKGVCTMPDGRRFEGYWLYGGRYEGEVNEDGKPHGQGVLIMPDGTRVECDYTEG